MQSTTKSLVFIGIFMSLAACGDVSEEPLLPAVDESFEATGSRASSITAHDGRTVVSTYDNQVTQIRERGRDGRWRDLAAPPEGTFHAGLTYVDGTLTACFAGDQSVSLMTLSDGTWQGRVIATASDMPVPIIFFNDCGITQLEQGLFVSVRFAFFSGDTDIDGSVVVAPDGTISSFDEGGLVQVISWAGQPAVLDGYRGGAAPAIYDLHGAVLAELTINGESCDYCSAGGSTSYLWIDSELGDGDPALAGPVGEDGTLQLRDQWPVERMLGWTELSHDEFQFLLTDHRSTGEDRPVDGLWVRALDGTDTEVLSQSGDWTHHVDSQGHLHLISGVDGQWRYRRIHLSEL